MAKFLVVQTLVAEPVDLSDYLYGQGRDLARAMVLGETPARCLYSWIPVDDGAPDRIYSLWQGDTGEAVAATLASSGLQDHLTSEIHQVDEVDWAAIA